MISIDGTNGQVAQYTLIEYNYFHDADPQASNGGETIRVGLSGLSLSDGFNTVENNLFVNCDSDAEVVSVKSKSNTVRYNTFRNNKGQVTARHGHNDSFYGNFFLGDGVKAGVGGLRIYGNDHKIYNNYFEKLTGTAINIDGGDFDAGPAGANYTSADLTAHWRAYRVQVTNNTVVNNTGSSFGVGLSYTYAPVDSRIANNIAKGTSGPLYNEAKTSNTVFEGNIGFGATIDNVSRTSAEIKNADPSFTTSGGLQKLSSGSTAAINSAVGSYAYVTEDMDGQSRSTNDVGADEYSIATISRQPLTSTNVGPNAP
jgi:poly(beta-D-mannuronate) lyase